MSHEIFKLLPHQQIVSKHKNVEEIFDLYSLGIFCHGLAQENIELVVLEPEREYKAHYHQKSRAVIYIISGEGQFQLDHHFIEYAAGTRIEIPAGVLHGFKTITTTLFLSIQSPPIINSENGEIDLNYGEEYETESK